jgi:hypothetical protein
MWLWLRKKLPKSFQLWSKLIGYVGALHFIVLFCLLFVYKGDNHSLSFTLNRHIDLNAAVVFLPLQKRVTNTNATSAAGKPTQSVAKLEEKKIEDKIVRAPKTKKEKASTCIATAAPKKKAKSINKKIVNKIQDKKPSSEALAKEDKQKNKELEKIEPEIKKPSPDTLAQDTKKVEELSLLATTTDAANAQTSTENIQYLGSLDLQALEMENILVAEVGQYWSPPPGISKNAVCEASVLVSTEGKIATCTIKKTSGITIYDVTARNALLKVSLPKQFWGKEFSITFKQ